MMRPGEPPTKDAAESLFAGLFFSPERYDLSAVGRMKFNRRLRRTAVTGAGVLYDYQYFKSQAKDERAKELIAELGETSDIVEVIREIIAIRNGEQITDDIDHLGNRRVRSGGRDGRERVPRRPGARRARRASERLALAEAEALDAAEELINAKPVGGGGHGTLRLLASCRSSWTRTTRCRK